MRWVEALKIYNEGKTWCVPRKGTADYENVRKIMRGEKSEPVKASESPKTESKDERIKRLREETYQKNNANLQKYIKYYTDNPEFWKKASAKEKEDFYGYLLNVSIPVGDDRVPKWARIGYKKWCSKGTKDCIKPELEKTKNELTDLKDDLMNIQRGIVPKKYQDKKRSKAGFFNLQNTLRNRIDELQKNVKQMGGAKKPRKALADKPKRKPSSWILALKKWNEGKPKWCVPKKGTADYEEVAAIRKKMSEPEAPPITPTIRIEEEPEPEPEQPIIPMKPSKTFEEEYKEFIEEIQKSEGSPFMIDYSAVGLITDYIFIYLLNKYKDECGVFVRKANNVMDAGIDISQFSEKQIRDGMEDKDITLQGIKFQIGKQIADCVEGGAKIVAIPFTVPQHANMMIYRVSDNSMEHYEPHGATYGNLPYQRFDSLIKLFQHWLNDWAEMGLIPKNPIFIPSSDLCPVGVKGLQAYEGQLRSQFPTKYNDKTIGGGFCQMWSLFYLEMCMKYPAINGAKLIKTAVDEINKMGIEGFASHIIKYTNGYNKVLQDYYKTNTNITSKKLLKDRELREKIRLAYNDLVKEYLTRNKPVLASSLSKQLVSLKTAVDQKWNEWNELKGKKDAEKTKAKKPPIEKQMNKIEDRIKELNRAILTLEAEQDMDEDSSKQKEINEINKRIDILKKQSEKGLVKYENTLPVSFEKLRKELIDVGKNYQQIIMLNKDKLKLINKDKYEKYIVINEKDKLYNTINRLLKQYKTAKDNQYLSYTEKNTTNKESFQKQFNIALDESRGLIDDITNLIEV